MFDAVVQALSQHALILSLASLLMLAGIGMAMRAARQFAQFRGELRAAEESVEAVSTPARANDDFDIMEEAFRRTPALRGVWFGIDSMLVRPTARGGAVVATMRPSEFISTDLLRQANINVGLFQAVPGYLVGVGLLFTFTSLLIALMAATGTMSAATPEATHDALRGLLSAAAMKFSSSIAGLLSSIGFSVWLRRQLHDIEAGLDRLGHQLDRRIPVRHPIQALAITNTLLSKQITVLEAIDTQWRGELVEKLVSGSNEALRQGLEPLVDGMNRMADRVGELSVESMERMVGEFTRRLETSMRGHTAQLIEDLKLLNTGFTSLMNTVRDIDRNFAQAIETGSVALDHRVGTAAAHLENALREGGAGLILGLKDGRDTLAKTAVEATQHMEGQLAGTAGGLAARLKESVAAMETDLGVIDKSFQGASAVVARELSAVTDRIIGDLERAAGSFRTADEKTAQALPTFLLSLGGLIDKITEVNRPMDELARDIERGTKSLGKAVDASARGLNQGRAAVERIAEVAESVAGMQGTFTALGQAVQRMESLDTTVRAITELEKRLSGLDRTFDTLDATMRRLASLEDAHTGLAEAGATFARIQSPLEALAASGERMVSLEPPLTALAVASQAVARAGSSFEALGSVFERALTIGQAADRLAAAVDRIAALEPVLQAIQEAAVLAAAPKPPSDAGGTQSTADTFRQIFGFGRHPTSPSDDGRP